MKSCPCPPPTLERHGDVSLIRAKIGRVFQKPTFASATVVESGRTADLFMKPKRHDTEDHITGRFG